MSDLVSTVCSNESIKANMMIVCQKLEQQANLAAQKEQVQVIMSSPPFSCPVFARDCVLQLCSPLVFLLCSPVEGENRAHSAALDRNQEFEPPPGDDAPHQGGGPGARDKGC